MQTTSMKLICIRGSSPALCRSIVSNYNPIMLRICEEYGREFCVSFNAAKSASMYCGKKLASCPDGLTFYIDGKEIAVVKNTCI